MSTLGTALKVTSFGETESFGCLIEGMPSGVKAPHAAVIKQMQRLTPGEQRQPCFEYLSGVVDGVTVGSPIVYQITHPTDSATARLPNSLKKREGTNSHHSTTAALENMSGDAMSALRRNMSAPGGRHANSMATATSTSTATPSAVSGHDVGNALAKADANRSTTSLHAAHAAPRPSMPDYAYNRKYGSTLLVARNGDRELMGRIGASVLAEEWLRQKHGVSVVGFVSQIGAATSSIDEMQLETITREDVMETGDLNAPNMREAYKFRGEVTKAHEEDDTIGGVVTCVCRSLPEGWGEPVFEGLEAKLAQAMLSIPNVKGFGVGAGPSVATRRGEENNDIFVKRGNRLGALSNNSGGVQGGVSNGETVYFSVYFAPDPIINKPQTSASYTGEAHGVLPPGPDRMPHCAGYSPCTVPKYVVAVEALAALVLMDVAMKASMMAACKLHPSASSEIAFLSTEDLQQKYEKEAKLRAVFQANLQKRMKRDAARIPAHYIYGGLLAGGLVIGVFLGKRWFGESLSYGGSFGSSSFSSPSSSSLYFS